MGFSIQRIVDDVEEPSGLYTTVGFNKDEDSRKSPQTTDEWPIQSFNWKDIYAPLNKEIKYKIYPMIGTWNNLKKDDSNYILTDPTKRTQEYGVAKVIFNRGILSTQAFSKSGKKGKTVTKEEAKELITNPSSTWRNRLGGQMLFNVNMFFKKASKNGGKYYTVLSELTDEVLIKELIKNKGTEIILINANSSESKTVDGKKKTIPIDDGTNKKIRENCNSVQKLLGSNEIRRCR